MRWRPRSPLTAHDPLRFWIPSSQQPMTCQKPHRPRPHPRNPLPVNSMQLALQFTDDIQESAATVPRTSPQPCRRSEPPDRRRRATPSSLTGGTRSTPESTGSGRSSSVQVRRYPCQVCSQCRSFRDVDEQCAPHSSADACFDHSVRHGAPRWKRSKTCGTSPAAMPMPLFSTDNSAPSAADKRLLRAIDSASRYLASGGFP